MDIDVTPSATPEVSIDRLDINMPNQKRFKREDTNTKNYFTEVKRVLLNNLDEIRLCKLHVLSFHTKYRKELRGNYIRADPVFDAWMCVLGKNRPQFDVVEFKRTNPSVLKKIEELRKTLHVSLGLIKEDEKKR